MRKRANNFYAVLLTVDLSPLI